MMKTRKGPDDMTFSPVEVGSDVFSLEKRAEASYAEYRRQKAIASKGRGFRLPL
jgi:hypothetical protein